MPPEQRKALNDELLSVDDVAELLKVPVGTLRKWRTGGSGPTAFRVGKYLRYRLSAVERFIKEQEDREPN
ncbi:helix-turn-helix domain-containing protein [Actinoplanes sp. NPDC049118]|uniref:helix-turn-helix domain-containing protein n=1 Tax=Actinoplanes sp. NPDC049118 TaxID=3155769 RepID=UPI0034078AF3